MPELHGKKVDNSRLANSGAVSKWQSLTLNRTQIDDDGISMLQGVGNNLEEVHIASDSISDHSMPVLCALPKLRSLLLDPAPRITDAGIASVSMASSLRELYLNGTQLTDVGIKPLLRLNHLWSLSLKHTRVTDAGVSKLEALSTLRVLVLDGTDVRGYGLIDIPFGERVSLSVEACPVDDETVCRLLASQKSVSALDLSRTLVTDRCLPAIAASPVEQLRLDGTAVTDQGLQHLCAHSSLGTLYLENTRISEAMCRRLKTESPQELTVYR